VDLLLLNDAGEKVRLGPMVAGKPVLLYFWATWCKPCRQTRPKVSDFARKYENQVKVLGINLGGLDSLEEVRKYRTRYKITYPLLLDRDNELAEFYSVFTIPSVIFIDSAGEIRYRANDPPANPEKFLSK
jgi:thiol-disulfide isomerase/thioredoxin